MSKFKWLLVACVSTGFSILAVFLYLQGLDRADKWASVLALFIALATPAIGLVTQHREARADAPAPPSPITNIGTITQSIVANRARVSQKNTNYRN